MAHFPGKTKLKTIYLLAACLSLYSLGFAWELPVFAHWQSLNTISYNPDQSGKEYSWDELYRAKFGLRDVQIQDARLSVILATEQFFDESHVKLNEFSISYDLDKLSISAGSREHGYGTAFWIDQQPILRRGFAKFNHQSMRMNSLMIAYESPLGSSSLDLGGNTHNQACALMSHRIWRPKCTLTISQEFRAKDSYRRYPVSITGIDLDLFSPTDKYHCKNVFALSYHPRWETRSHTTNAYVQSEQHFRILKNSSLIAGIMYESRLYTPKETSRYQLAIRHKTGSFVFSPIAELCRISDEDLWQYRFLTSYHLNKQSSIGLAYEHNRYQSSQSHHSLALVLDFVLD